MDDASHLSLIPMNTIWTSAVPTRIRWLVYVGNYNAMIDERGRMTTTSKF